MAAGFAAGRQAQHFASHHLGAVQHHQLVHWTDKGHVRIAPAHHLGDGQLFQRILHDAGQHVGQLGASGLVAVEKGFALAVQTTLELGNGVQRDAARFQLLAQRRAGLAIGAQRHRHRHDFFNGFFVGGHRQHGGNAHAQATRAGKNLRGDVGGDEFFLGQAGHNRAGKAGGQARQRLGWEFFGKQFDKQGVFHGVRSGIR